ncbi:hypothetical protein ASPCAL05301 [Aspergillus calidoustus]|uniref:Ketoreductase domain-containing protein n=1 Tax=Aspergillus calidoustus TaxID=454130 RepID=A0A0U5C6M2_ASPCI|nr:hypothetical protein ASPCAL05301 [Aspergillus calidoustus]
MSDLPGFDNYFNLTGKVALVTGGSRGLGLHIATALLRAGARTVFITARKEPGVREAVDKLNALPGIKGKAIGIAANVSATEEIQALVEQVKQKESQLDILIANAGATWGGPFESSPDWASQKVVDLNVRGVFNLVRLFTPMLQASGTPTSPSRVVIVSSVAGSVVSHTGENGTIMYSASKAAATHLARNLAVELGPKNITANSLSPGFFPSKLANGLIEKLGGEEELRKGYPRQRLGVPDDIGASVLFLVSPGANYVTGVDLVVDGGSRLARGKL